jgi:hypothetical protein
MRLALVLAIGLVVARVARADQPTEPWAQGVSQSSRDEANALFDEGNQLFARDAHAPALAKYRAAIALWDHPAIRFNMAVTLIRLDRPLEAADALDAALRYGQQPFSSLERYREALDYRALVAKQLAQVEVTCDRSGTRVALDGKPWFVCPGTRTVRVLAGRHQLVAEQPGYLTLSRALVLVGGTDDKQAVELMSYEGAVTYRYRSPRWLPWTVAASGVAVAIGGGALWLFGNSRLESFEREWTLRCPGGCTLDEQPVLADRRSGAVIEKGAGMTLAIAGSAVALAGTAFAIWNRPIRVLPAASVSSGTAMLGVAWSR